MNEQIILEFINLVRFSVPNSEEVFTKGNCGSFARMLLFAFPQGKIMIHQGDHFIFEYEESIYDITGNVNGKYNYKKLRYLENIGDINRIICSLTPRYKK